MPVQSLALQAALAGLALGLSLAFSLGPQNLRLIRAGVLNSHALTVASTGYASEIAIVLIGVGWMNRTVAALPALAGLLQALGIGFLVWCAFRAFGRRARCGAPACETEGAAETRRAAILAMLVVTWLNPLVYLETMFLVGMLAAGYGEAGWAWFSAGYLAAAGIRIYGWSMVGRTVSPWLATPRRRMQFETLSGSFLVAAATLLTLRFAGAFPA